MCLYQKRTTLKAWLHVFIYLKKNVGPFAILSIELIHDISKVKIILKNKNIAKKSDFQLNSLAII